METFVKGDIVVVPFPFSNLYSSKKRPALLLADSGGDVVLCQITSQSVKDNHAVTIELPDIENGSLNNVSNARPNKLFTADKSIISYKVGKLNELKMQAVIEAVVKLFTE